MHADSATRILARPFYPAGSILCLHSVTTPSAPSDDPLHIPLERLRDLVHALRRVSDIVPLKDLVQRHLMSKSTAGCIALTFDDAYVAMERAVRDVLEPENVPCTIFAVSRALESGQAFWWDRIAEIATRASEAQWRQFEREARIPDSYRATDSSDRFAQVRKFILAECAGRLLPPVGAATTELERAVQHRTVQRSMTMQELVALSASPVVDIGVHTETHAVLTRLSSSEAMQEVQGCYQTLRSQIPDTVPILAIPYGLFDQSTADVAHAAGMSACLTLTGHSLQRRGRNGISRFCLDARLNLPRVLLQTSGLLESARLARGQSPDDLPELPTPQPSK